MSYFNFTYYILMIDPYIFYKLIILLSLLIDILN